MDACVYQSVLYEGREIHDKMMGSEAWYRKTRHQLIELQKTSELFVQSRARLGKGSAIESGCWIVSAWE